MSSKTFHILSLGPSGEFEEGKHVTFDEASDLLTAGTLVFPPRYQRLVQGPSADQARKDYFNKRAQFTSERTYEAFLKYWIATLNPGLRRGEAEVIVFLQDFNTLLGVAEDDTKGRLRKYLKKSTKGDIVLNKPQPQHQATFIETGLASLRVQLWRCVIDKKDPPKASYKLFTVYVRWAKSLCLHTIQEDLDLISILRGEQTSNDAVYPSALAKTGYVKKEFQKATTNWLAKEILPILLLSNNKDQVGKLKKIPINQFEFGSGYELYAHYQKERAEGAIASFMVEYHESQGQREKVVEWKGKLQDLESKVDIEKIWQSCHPDKILNITKHINPDAIRSGYAAGPSIKYGDSGLDLQNLNKQIQRDYYRGKSRGKPMEHASGVSSLTKHITTTGATNLKKELENGEVLYTLEKCFGLGAGVTPKAFVLIADGKKMERKDIIVCIGSGPKKVHRIVSEQVALVGPEDLAEMVNVKETKRASKCKDTQSKNWPRAIKGVAFRDEQGFEYSGWTRRVNGPQVLNPQLVREGFRHSTPVAYVNVVWMDDEETWEPASDLHGWKRLGDRRMSVQAWREFIYAVAKNMEESADLANHTNFHEEDFSGLLNQLKLIDNGDLDSSAQDSMQIIPRTPKKGNLLSQSVTPPKKYTGKKKQGKEIQPLRSPFGMVTSGRTTPVSLGHEKLKLEVEEPDHEGEEPKHEVEAEEPGVEVEEPEVEVVEPEVEVEEPEVEEPDSDGSKKLVKRSKLEGSSFQDFRPSVESDNDSEDERDIMALVKGGNSSFN
ncbi:hypothetical protein TWF481_002694 [Arthrobotrys musiformis]|uniref:Uncharacterized protein n=1 Tax=Arthrobotrys musiformis TaxID=47236 RepID=A0AAV9VQZ1_9PEZI